MKKKIKAEEYSKWDKNLYKEDEKIMSLGELNVSKEMSALFQIGDAPVLTKDGCDRDGRRKIEISPLRQARESQYQIVETALKDYEELKKLKLLPYPKINDEEYRRSVIKRLQALEIIKEKELDVHRLKTYSSVYEYNRKYEEYEYHLTQEEYDLLKEIINNENSN